MSIFSTIATLAGLYREITHSSIVEKGYQREEGNRKLKRGEYDDAIACYDRAIRIDPNDAYSYSLKANALAELGYIDDAIECCDTILLYKYDNYLFKFETELLIEQELFDELLELCDISLEHKTKEPQIYLSKARVLAILERYDEADKCCDIALNSKSKSLRQYALSVKSIISFELKNYEDAIKYSESLLKIDPKNTFAKEIITESLTKFNNQNNT